MDGAICFVPDVTMHVFRLDARCLCDSLGTVLENPALAGNGPWGK